MIHASAGCEAPASPSSLLDRAADDVPVGPGPGLLLIAVSWLAVIAAGVLAPVLPKMAAYFAAAPAVDLMIGFVATMPALAVAILSIGAGHLADRLGARPLLLTALAGFGLLGLAPFWLDSLPAIVGSRFLTGICEAGVMTTATTLLGSYYLGRARDRWLTAQVASVNLMGVVVVFCGGIAGQFGWRVPFLAYGFALLLFLPVAIFIRPTRTVSVAGSIDDAAGLSWAGLALRCAATTLVSVSVYVVVIQFSFLLAERGIVEPMLIGSAIATAATGMVAGSLVTAAILRVRPATRLVAALLLISVGAALAARGGGLPAMIIGMWIVGTGAGIGVPTLLAMTVGGAPARSRGIITGAWTSALFLGQFLNPPLFVGLRAWYGSQAAGIAYASIVYLAFAVVVALLTMRRGATTTR